LPLLTIPLHQDQILISKFLVGRKTSEIVENADESSFGEGQAPAPTRAELLERIEALEWRMLELKTLI